MKAMKSIYLLFLLLSIFFNSIRAFSCDTLKSEDFNSLAEKFKERMKGQDKFSTEDALSLVRVYNTFHITAYFEKAKSFASSFIRIFEKNYLKTIAKQLKCTYGKGMSIYSPLHDLYVGISTTYRCKDHFIIN